jgi:RNA polymerase sigma-70 factor (ECF subfamily)
MLEREELCAEVRRAIDRLPESARTVLLLRDIEGVPLEEIAAMLAITPNAVKIRVHRARQALRTLLDPSLAGRRTS